MPQVNRVVHVVHNLKGGGKADLGQRTLIVGPNGSGKSAIINAVELATTGKASDIAGRSLVAQGSALATLANGSGAWAEATLNDGATCRWEITRTGDKTSRAKRDGPEGVLPLREVLAHLTGSADKARKFLLQHACEGIDNTHIVAKLSRDDLSRYQRLTDGRLSPIDNLLAVTDLAAKKERDTKRHAAGAKETEEAVAAGLGPAPTASVLAEAKGNLYEAGVTLRAAEATLEQATTHVVLPLEDREKKIAALNAWNVRAVNEVRELRTELRALPRDEKADQRRTLLSVVNLMETVWTEGPCLACGKSFDRGSWKAHADHVRTAVEAASAKHTQQNKRRREIEARLSNLDTTTVRVAARLVELDVPDAADPHAARATVAVARSWHAEQDATYERLVREDASWERVRRARTVRREAERESHGWGALAAVCKALVRELVMDAVAVFQNRVQRFLPKGETFAIEFVKSAVRYGLLRDGEIHTALSGAEWARVSSALAAVCTPSDARLPILIPEDRAWDAKTLRRMLKGLDDYRGQVIMATTIKPYRGVPAGWTLIEIGG